MDQSKQQQQKSTRPLYIINLFDIKTTGFCDAQKIPNNTFTFILTLTQTALWDTAGFSVKGQVWAESLCWHCVCVWHSSVGDDQVPSTSVMWSLHAQLCRGRITLPQKLQFYMVACLHVLLCGQLSESQTLSVMKWQQPLLCLYRKLM